MSIQNWEHFFKPEVRSSGRALLTQGKVFVAQPSDTEIIATIRASPPLKVSLKTKSISNPVLSVDCNCPAGKKDLFCKHIWAGLLAANEKNSDFFEFKKEIEIENTPNLKSPAWNEKQIALKEKQKNYRKEQYQKNKKRLKDLKNNKKYFPEERILPLEVQKALNFFSKNGFELREALSKELVSAAKKKLARIFHPDVGGSHNEILELNRQAEILIQFKEKYDTPK